MMPFRQPSKDVPESCRKINYSIGRSCYTGCLALPPTQRP